ncbi:hypothetical protein [Planktotalea frisia]|uniref:hypothetical protein n=1 Tax=Planktotalea frisia TaxID=696762 RepID=UPI002354A208|nr:hypothetical protein [Planktotalea frisia]
MNILYWVIGGVFVLGISIALYERRKGKVLLKHDFNQLGTETETDRAATRVQDEMAARTAFTHLKH